MRKMLLPLLHPVPNGYAEKPVLLMSGDMRFQGIFCDLRVFIKWIWFCEKMNYTPVVDMCHMPNLYLEDDLIGAENSYEYYYHQPTSLTLEEALKAKKVIPVNWSRASIHFNRYQRKKAKMMVESDSLLEDDMQHEFKRIFNQYFHLKDEAAEFVDKQWNALVQPGERVLGLLCRGTDYLNNRPKGHHVQPTMEQIVAKVNEVVTDYAIDKIFAATEDAAILAQLRSQFGDKLVYIDCPRVDITKSSEAVATAFRNQKVDRKMNGMYYLASIYCLARCNCLVAGVTMAAPFIKILPEKPFEYEFFWDLGLY